MVIIVSETPLSDFFDVFDVRVVVPISTGKDSQACLKLALSEYKASQVIGLFCDTGWEHPLSYQHLETIKQKYGVYIVTIGDSNVEAEVLKIGRFPNALARFCTDRLKIESSKKFYNKLMKEKGSGFEVWLGMRSDESTKRKNRFSNKISSELYTPQDINKSFPKYLAKGGVMFRLPILDWSTDEVFSYIGDENANPLYAAGFDRVGCFPCLASTSKKHANCFNYDDFGKEQKQRVEILEFKTGVKHEPANTDQICMFCNI